MQHPQLKLPNCTAKRLGPVYAVGVLTMPKDPAADNSWLEADLFRFVMLH